MKEKILTTKSCGLCGKNKRLMKTPCCDQWICDDVHKYVMFSYATNSCYRNHDRYTLCSFHHHEGHKGNWKDCKACKKEIAKTEMYVWYGTNEFNFEKLENPPKFKPTLCSQCKAVIDLGNEGHSISGEGYTCMRCTGFQD
jgi:hypothetical protein